MENVPMITVEVTIDAPIEIIWKRWTTPADIMHWNNFSDDWHTTKAELNLKDDGIFLYRMEAKDGSFGFDFTGKYDTIITNKLIEYTLFDGRKAINTFAPNADGSTTIIEIFAPDKETPLELQKEFCQTVLNNFKAHVETYDDEAF